MPAEMKKFTKLPRRIREKEVNDANHVPQPSAGEPQGQRKICQDPSRTRWLCVVGYSSRVMLSGRLSGSQAFFESRRAQRSPGNLPRATNAGDYSKDRLGREQRLRRRGSEQYI